MESYFQKRQKLLAAKFGLSSLSLESDPVPKEKTVSEILLQREREEAAFKKAGYTTFGSRHGGGLGLTVRF
jgi:hypothetical protein